MELKPYSLYKRGRFYYCRFRLPDGSFSTATSTGETARTRAEAWAIKHLQENGQYRKPNEITLEEFSRGFFDIDGEWAASLKVIGKRITERQCQSKTALLNNHVLPRLGEMRINQIDRRELKELRNGMFTEGASGSLINKVLSCIKVIMESAEEQGIISGVPKIERAGNLIRNPRGILTVDETKELFRAQWPDFRSYAASLLAASSGLRMGEILALTHADVQDHYITVSKTWDHSAREVKPTTKTGRPRTVVMPSMVQQELDRLKEVNPHGQNPEQFLFFSTGSAGCPFDGSRILKHLKAVLKQIGISEEQRKERNITFHSFRHWFNSILVNAKVPLHKVQSLTGHLSEEMTANYYHPDDLSDVLEIQNDIFKTISEAPPGNDVH